MRSRSTIELDVGDRTYEVGAKSFRPGIKASWTEPGEEGDVMADNVVSVFDASGNHDVTTFGAFVLEFAVHHMMKPEDAENFVLDRLLRQCESDRDADLESRFDTTDEG